MKVYLYRGITVQDRMADEVIRNIKLAGIRGDEGNWKFSVPVVKDVVEKIDSLYSNDDLDPSDVLSEANQYGFCASGSESGALYYAKKHNFGREDNTPIIIEFEVDLDKVYVDGRDFLCTAFQLFDRDSNEFYEKQLEVLENLFGSNIKRYFEKSSSTTKQLYRIAISNLACFDRDIVKHHLDNSLTVYGRGNTKFQSAFFVQGPLSPSCIKSVRKIDDMYFAPEPYIKLHNFIVGQIR